MTFSRSPRMLKAGITVMDPKTGQVKRTITLQYNPDSLTRTMQIAAASAEGGDRSEALRLKGPPVETFRLEAVIDATDQMQAPDRSPNVRLGIHPQLAALESLIYPESAALQANNDLAGRGALEILPMESPLALFVWSDQRVVPVRITDFSVTEESFDPLLNPIRAKVTLGLRTLSVDDLGFNHRGGGLFMSYLKNKEALAKKASTAAAMQQSSRNLGEGS